MSVNLPFSRVTVIGSGLIGTSIGLALSQRGLEVTMRDQDARAQGIAQALIGAKTHEIGESDLVVSAVPLSAFSSVIKLLEGSTFGGVLIDVASVKTKPSLEVSTSGLDQGNFLPTHPMAGREVGGAESARADLFEGRPWIIDSSQSNSQAISCGVALIEASGAFVIDIPAAAHDQAVALVSHLPQLVSSLLAKQLIGKPEEWLGLAGSGLRDTTRIAASDSGLWKEIITANSAAITPLLQKLSSDLAALMENLTDENRIAEFISEGQVGRAAIPGKHGGKAREYTFLPIVIEDKPGQLAAIFEECAKASVNIEDLSIEHSPGQETGLITLAVSVSDAVKLSEHLLSHGWDVHSPRS
jgi:prephenate dehydrogenase